VINDLATDQRVHKHCLGLQANGYEVLLIGRTHAGCLPLLSRPYATHRMRLPFDKGVLFYASFNLALFFQLLFRKADLLFSNDLDTLVPNFLVSRLKNIPLIYDSHEYFTEVPELVGRPFVRSVWARLEQFILPKLQHIFTVSLPIADAYAQKYGVCIRVIRNVPMLSQAETMAPADPPVILYQGSVNVGRGIDLAIRSMQHLDGVVLHIAGTGDVMDEMRRLAHHLGLEDRVVFLGRLPFDELATITRTASIGISLEESLGLNYQFALPNKLFDYIHAGVPVLVSDLPAMRDLVTEHGVGEVLSSRQPELLAQQLRRMLSGEQQQLWRANCATAAKKLNWREEVKEMDMVLKKLHG
jgi:glycosyltransferase involved in cell wall biosynthesis